MQRDDVKAGDDLGDAAHGMQVALGAVVLAGVPFLRQAAKGAQVPGGYEQVAVQRLGGDVAVQGGS